MAKNELVSLGLIFYHPLHAYAINAVIKEMGLEQWAHISQASVYAALTRLEREECVVVSSEKVGNMPDRKVYSITDKGKARFSEEVRLALTDNAQGPNSFHLGLIFLYGLPASEIRGILEKRIEQLSDAIERIRARNDECKKEGVAVMQVSMDAAIDHLSIEKDVSVKLLSVITDDSVLRKAAEHTCSIVRKLIDMPSAVPPATPERQ